LATYKNVEMKELVGRKSERAILTKALESKNSELIVVYGRRRIGKTYLIREMYKNNIQFEFSGIYQASLKEQLKNFHLNIFPKKSKHPIPKDWIEAFYQLSTFINALTTKKKKVIFIDEFPWLDTRKSNFLAAFDNFWNSYASKKKDLIVVICGSAASYMIKNMYLLKSTRNALAQMILLIKTKL
jgi:AAA+ ATPase superfamily predicted ATPase